jgi:hypothetical protein
MTERDRISSRSWHSEKERWFLGQPKYENWKHPELQPGEVFLADMLPSDIESVQSPSRLDRLPLEHKRVGIRSFDARMRKLNGLRPVFLKESELDEKQVVNIGFIKDTWLVRYGNGKTETF